MKAIVIRTSELWKVGEETLHAYRNLFVELALLLIPTTFLILPGWSETIMAPISILGIMVYNIVFTLHLKYEVSDASAKYFAPFWNGSAIFFGTAAVLAFMFPIDVWFVNWANAGSLLLVIHLTSHLMFIKNEGEDIL